MFHPMSVSFGKLNQDGTIAPDSMTISPLDLAVSDDPFDRLDELSPAIICEHPTLGFEVSECHIRRRAYVSNIIPRTSAGRIKNARRKYIGSFIVSVNDTPVFTADSATAALTNIAASDDTIFTIVFAPNRCIPVADRRSDSPLHLSVDQSCVIHVITTVPTISDDPDCPDLIVRSLNTTSHSTPEEQTLGSFTRCKLQRLPNWNQWQDGEFKQLDSMAKQEWYPLSPPADTIILRQH